MRRWIAAAVVLAALGGCTSIDSVKDKKLDLCGKIRNEAVRAQCIKDVPSR